MDLLHTTKKFGMYGGHIEGDIEPANEKCHFPKGAKLKTTCKFVSIFSCCIESYGTAFQKKLICTIQCFERPNNIHFLTETENIISDTIWHFFCKKSKLSILKYFEKVFIKDSNLFILLLKTSFRFKRRLKFLFGNVEYLHVKLSQRLLFQSKSFL